MTDRPEGEPAPRAGRHPGGSLGWWVAGVVAALLALAAASLAYAQLTTVHGFADRVPGACYWTDAMLVGIVCQGFPGAAFESLIRNFGLAVFQIGPAALPLSLMAALAGEFRPLLILLLTIGGIVVVAVGLRAGWVRARLRPVMK